MSKDSRRNADGYRQMFRKHFIPILINAGPRAISLHHRRIAQYYGLAGATEEAAINKLAAFAWLPDPRVAVRKLRTALQSIDPR